MTFTEQERFKRNLRKALRALRDFDQATIAFLMDIADSHLSYRGLSDALNRWESEAATRKREIRDLWVDVYWIPAESNTRSTLKLEAVDQSIGAIIRAVRSRVTFLQSIAELRQTIASQRS